MIEKHGNSREEGGNVGAYHKENRQKIEIKATYK